MAKRSFSRNQNIIPFQERGKKMKKVVTLSLILLITIFMMGNVYAALSCKVSVTADKPQITKQEEFTVDFNVYNIQSEKGLIGFNAILEYDKESLDLVKMEGKNGWETPTEGSSYNGANGKIVLTRSGLGKNDETIFSATFKAKPDSKQNLMITLKNIKVADGTTPAKIALAYQNITVTDGTSNPMPDPGTDEDDNNNNDNNAGDNKPSTGTNSTVVGGNNNGNKNTSTSNLNKNPMNSKSGLPKAGTATATIFVLLVIGGVLVAIAFLIKIKIINKEIDKHE